MRGTTLIATDIAAFALLGALLGRGRFLWLVIPAPIIFWSVWAHEHYGGKGDDVTGIAATFLGVAGLVGVALGIGLHQVIRRSLR